MPGPLKLFSALVQQAPELLRGKNAAPLEQWMNQLKNKFPTPAIERAFGMPEAPTSSFDGPAKLEAYLNAGKTGPLTKQQVLERLKPLNLESKDLKRPNGTIDPGDFDNEMTAHEIAAHVMNTHPAVQENFRRLIVDELRPKYPDFADRLHVLRGAQLRNAIDTIMTGELPFRQHIPRGEEENVAEILGDIGPSFQHDVAQQIMDNPVGFGVDPNDFNRAGGYRWDQYQRLIPEEAHGYFEHGLFSNDPAHASLTSNHFSGHPGMLGHVRGTLANEVDVPMAKAYPYLPDTNPAVPRTYIEELQSDAGKKSNSPILHNVHGVLAKMSLLHAMEQGPGSQLWLPNAAAIASVRRGKHPNDYAPIYEGELGRQFYKYLEQKYGVKPQQQMVNPNEEWIDKQPTWNVIAPPEDVRQDILDKGLPHLAHGGRVA